MSGPTASTSGPEPDRAKFASELVDRAAPALLGAARTGYLADRRRAGEDAAACAYRWPVDHCATFEAEPAQVSAPARTRLVTDQHAVGAESVAAGA